MVRPISGFSMFGWPEISYLQKIRTVHFRLFSRPGDARMLKIGVRVRINVLNSLLLAATLSDERFKSQLSKNSVYGDFAGEVRFCWASMGGQVLKVKVSQILDFCKIEDGHSVKLNERVFNHFGFSNLVKGPLNKSTFGNSN